ncbi:MAG: hypothetical protein H6Q90_4264 [Deltaproteobacteria bacterium]|nr:hypothetical protein [Deltaproteobacteria bacterium]
MPGMGELLIIVMILIMLPLTGLWVWTLVDCAMKEPSEGNDKIVWILIIVFAGVIGAAIYFFARRPQRMAKFGR